MLLEVRRPYVTSTPRDGWAEQDATSWRSSSLSALGALIKQLGERHTIHAIGLTGQCPSVVPLDDHGTPLRPGLIYRDNRAVAEAESLNARPSARKQLHALTGHVPAAFHVAAKILWIRANEPDVFRATRLFVQPTELLALTLTGDAVTDWSMAAASALLNLRERRWAPELVEYVGLEMSQLPVPYPSWSVVGALAPVARASLRPVHVDPGGRGRRRQHRLRTRRRGHVAGTGERDGRKLDVHQHGGRRADPGPGDHPLPERGRSRWLRDRGRHQHCGRGTRLARNADVRRPRQARCAPRISSSSTARRRR